MNATFKAHVDALPRLFEQLLAAAPHKVCEVPNGVPKQCVYALAERDEYLYVGRSNRFRARMCDHGRPSSPQAKSAFAFRLAREATGRTKASYKPEGSRKELMKDPAFLAEFTKAKARIAQMQVRFVEVRDPIRQALLEMYASLALGTRYNSFDNH